MVRSEFRNLEDLQAPSAMVIVRLANHRILRLPVCERRGRNTGNTSALGIVELQPTLSGAISTAVECLRTA